VYRRVRPRNVIAGFGRPAYTSAPAPTPPNPDQLASFRRYAAAINIRDLSKTDNLKFPQTGGAVLALQRSLNLVANKGLVEDGIFGAATTAAVKDLQRLFKLEVDGIVGPRTKEALFFLLGRIERGEA
jgi:peptidoglycan hydrolase-like protein with peptidoglycan-binding domain